MDISNTTPAYAVPEANLVPVSNYLKDMMAIPPSRMFLINKSLKVYLEKNPGSPVFDADSFVLNVGKLAADALARLSMVRDGHPRTVEVRLTKYAVQGKKIVTVQDPPWRGLRVEYPSAMPPSAARPTGASPFAAEGVIVLEVAEDSPAQKAGLQPGMIITHVARTAVNTPKEFQSAASAVAGPVELRIGNDAQNAVRTVQAAE